MWIRGASRRGVGSFVASSASRYNHSSPALGNAGRIVHISPEVVAQNFFLNRLNQFESLQISPSQGAGKGILFLSCLITRIAESASVSACCSSRRPLPVSRCNLLRITFSIFVSFSSEKSKIASWNGSCHNGYFNAVLMFFL